MMLKGNPQGIIPPQWVWNSTDLYNVVIKHACGKRAHLPRNGFTLHPSCEKLKATPKFYISLFEDRSLSIEAA